MMTVYLLNIRIGLVFTEFFYYINILFHIKSIFYTLLAQIIYKSFDTPEYAPTILPSLSNFECYNKCINDPNCKFVVRKRIKGSNCFIKTVFNDSNPVELARDSEAIAIKGII
jgi:hypothetical protein